MGIPSWRSSICRAQDGKTGLDHSLVPTQEALETAPSIAAGVQALGPPRTGQGEGAASLWAGASMHTSVCARV